ncbi:uncharacterized protein PHACADRAFT_265929, partial [Phanerochaete carnosa HHB-10118-sp]
MPLRSQDFAVPRRILCSVLRHTQLTWVLESGKLQFTNFHSDLITSADVLFVPMELAVDGTTITLDVAEQFEWLLRSDCLLRER